VTTFGVLLPTVSGTGTPLAFAHVAGAAAAAEDAGFASVWVGQPRPTGRPAGSTGPPALEAVTLLGALAVRTRSVRLGMLAGRESPTAPGVLAKMVTTLDVLSGGRIVLGLGAGGDEAEEDGTGADPPGGPPGLDALEETVRVCRALFTGDDVTFAGAHVRLDHARNRPGPVQPGGPDLLIGGGEATLGLAARYADQCLMTTDGAGLARSVGMLRRHCTEVGRDPDQVEVVWLAPRGVTAPPEGALRRIAGAIDAGADQVLFRPAADAATVTALGRALGLTARPV
jgi:alkanesulfonate monooxygenase SsuD/methylene tetrahydromethanopterin reductase-like flavin-dependent oxidoreductase (luciferase family)